MDLNSLEMGKRTAEMEETRSGKKNKATGAIVMDGTEDHLEAEKTSEAPIDLTAETNQGSEKLEEEEMREREAQTLMESELEDLTTAAGQPKLSVADVLKKIVSPDKQDQSLLHPEDMITQTLDPDEDAIEEHMAKIAQEANAAHNIRLESLKTTKVGRSTDSKTTSFTSNGTFSVSKSNDPTVTAALNDVLESYNALAIQRTHIARYDIQFNIEMTENPEDAIREAVVEILKKIASVDKRAVWYPWVAQEAVGASPREKNIDFPGSISQVMGGYSKISSRASTALRRQNNLFGDLDGHHQTVIGNHGRCGPLV